jgi:hypothetical protein
MPEPVSSTSDVDDYDCYDDDYDCYDDDYESYGDGYGSYGEGYESYGDDGADSESYGDDGADSESYGVEDDNEDSQGDSSTEIRRSKRKRRPSERYTAGASTALKVPSQSSDMPSATEAMKSEDADKWIEAIHSELADLREMRML